MYCAFRSFSFSLSLLPPHYAPSPLYVYFYVLILVFSTVRVLKTKEFIPPVPHESKDITGKKACAALQDGAGGEAQQKKRLGLTSKPRHTDKELKLPSAGLSLRDHPSKKNPTWRRLSFRGAATKTGEIPTGLHQERKRNLSRLSCLVVSLLHPRTARFEFCRSSHKSSHARKNS